MPFAGGHCHETKMKSALVHSDNSSVFPRMLDLGYPNVERGDGVRLHMTDGGTVLDGCSGGAMTACLGHGVPELVDALAEQSQRITYVYNHHFTNDRQEQYAERLLTVAAPEMARVRFASGGAEANEAAVRLARSYHVERGDERRRLIVSTTEAYHGATFGALALTGRRSLQQPYGEYLPHHSHVAAGDLAELDRLLDEHGAEVAAFFCEPVSAASRAAWSPPAEFWEGLAERRGRHGFLVCFDEIVTGMGRTGDWFAYQGMPIEPDIVTAGKGMGAGYFPLSAALCREHVYEAFANGSREFELGHTWDGAPLSCAVGLATLEYIQSHGLVERVRERGPSLRGEVEAALGELEMVRVVRGHGFLIGVELVDPRDGESPLPAEVNAAAMVDGTALEHGLLVTSGHASADGYAGDQVLLAPAYTAADADLAEMVERLAVTIAEVEQRVKQALAGVAA
jgi:adenosylmethionine-8-amino-7-oxononanoate aminotransferase